MFEKIILILTENNLFSLLQSPCSLGMGCSCLLGLHEFSNPGSRLNALATLISQAALCSHGNWFLSRQVLKPRFHKDNEVVERMSYDLTLKRWTLSSSGLECLTRCWVWLFSLKLELSQGVLMTPLLHQAPWGALV